MDLFYSGVLAGVRCLRGSRSDVGRVRCLGFLCFFMSLITARLSHKDRRNSFEKCLNSDEIRRCVRRILVALRGPENSK